MKTNKLKKTNKEAAKDLEQILSKSIMEDKKISQKQIELAKQNEDMAAIGSPVKVNLDVSEALKAPLIGRNLVKDSDEDHTTIEVENEVYSSSSKVAAEKFIDKPQVVVHAPQRLQKFINSREEEENLIKPQGQTNKKPHTQFSVYLLESEMDKVTKLRSFLMQKGVNTNITSAQLVRVALRKLEYTDDLVELFLGVHSEDGRKKKGRL